MYLGEDWDPLDTAVESDIFTVDFTAALLAGETISSATVAIAVVGGTDATPSTRLSGSAGISGNKVSQTIDVRGLSGAAVYYRLDFVITTNQRPAVSRWSHFWSRPPN